MTRGGGSRDAARYHSPGAGSAEFNKLKQRAGVHDGNLSVYLRKPEDAGYVELEKRFVGRKPQTLCHLTSTGRDAWIAYIDHIHTLLSS